jgi:predicted ATPase/DNA-binding SARP family transcriptional activator
MGTQGQDNPQTVWRIEMFGGLRALGGGQVIERFVTQKTAALLALLALVPGRRLSREELVDALWPEADPSAGRDRLSQALVWLRPRLEPNGTERGGVLLADRLHVRLNPNGLTTDVAEFEAALELAHQAPTPKDQEVELTRAVGLYSGDLLPGFYDDWVLAPRQHLLDGYIHGLRTLGRLHDRAGDLTRAAEFARLVLAADSLHEEAHADLIRLLAAQGQTTAALRQFQDLSRLLARELNTKPSAATLALVESIRESRAEIPPAQPRPPAWPTPLTRFFGREAEIERLQQMVCVEGTRLVTLTGSGGAGKTRLALASRLKDTFGDTAAFIPLADLDDARMIPTAIADALRLPHTADRPPLEQVVSALTGRPALLVLDNLEHLQPDASPLIRELLERLPTLVVLATTRQRLGLDGEREISVTSLPLPETTATLEQILATPSARLFIDRARSVRPQFDLTPANAEAVARICARLDGIPLALELCAAWAQTLTPAQMLDKLTRRFDLLVSRRADIPPRHRTMRAAIEYSYLQLPPDLQHLFSRLSVFRGGWTLEAAEAVCGTEAQDMLSLLAALTEMRERSLIVAEEVGDSTDEPTMRYRILDTLQEFAWEQLSLADLTARRRAHLAFFLRMAEGETTKKERWAARLAPEQENLRAALAWSLEDRDTVRGLRLATALTSYWSIRGPLQEGYDWLRRLLARVEQEGVEDKDDLLANSWGALGHLAWAQGDFTSARVAHERALALRRISGYSITESLYRLGITAYRQDDYETAQVYLEESLALSEAQDDQAGISRVLLNLGNIAYERQDHARAETFFEQTLAIERTLGNRDRVAGGLNNLALTAIAAADYPKAVALLEDALAIRHELTDHYGAATVLVSLATAARLQKQRERTRSLLAEGLALARQVGDRHVTAIYLMEFGLLADADGDSARAVPLLAASQRLFHSLGGSVGSAHAEAYEQALTQAHGVLDQTTFDTLWSQGQTTPPEQIVSSLLEK